MAGGKRKGAGRPANPDKKISYATKIRPDQIEWLRSKKRGFAAQLIEEMIDTAMQKEKYMEYKDIQKETLSEWNQVRKGEITIKDFLLGKKFQGVHEGLRVLCRSGCVNSAMAYLKNNGLTLKTTKDKENIISTIIEIEAD